MRVDLTLPQPVVKTVALYLMIAIGFKGGVGMTESGAGFGAIMPIAVGIALSVLLPFIGYRLLRMTSCLGQVDAAAVAAHYDSISIVTFLTVSQVLTDRGDSAEGYLVAIAAAMEAPAIVAGLWIASRQIKAGATSGKGEPRALSMREVVLKGSIVALLGVAIGWMTGSDGLTDVKPFIVDPFKGVLCLFLLNIWVPLLDAVWLKIDVPLIRVRYSLDCTCHISVRD